MAYREYVSELVGMISRLPYPDAEKLINRAWKDIRKYRRWSWLVGYGDLVTPAVITAGSVTVTNGSPAFVFDATAAAALDAVALSNPPLASSQLGIGRQVRIGASTSGTAGPFYTIIAWDLSTLTATVDRNYAETTAAAQSYQVYKVYYQPPPSNGSAAPDFKRYLTINNMQDGYSIRGRRLFYDQAKINAVDPQRGGTGIPYVLANNRSVLGQSVGATSYVTHELYPNPVSQRTLNCWFDMVGQDLSDTVDLPPSMDDAVLMARAKYYAADWAAAHIGEFPELGNVNWIAYQNTQEKQYLGNLIQAIKQDGELMPEVPYCQGSSFDFPLGGQFLQSHDISSLVGGF